MQKLKYTYSIIWHNIAVYDRVPFVVILVYQLILRLTLRQWERVEEELRQCPLCPAMRTNRMLHHCTTLQYTVVIFDMVVRRKNGFNSVAILPLWMRHWDLVAAWPAWPAYIDDRKRENIFFLKNRIIVASKCWCSVQFGPYVTWVWMENYAFV